MVALRVWWLTQVPEVAKVIIAAISGAGATAVLLGAVLDIPNQVNASTEANTRQDGEIAALQAARSENDRNVSYLTCLVEVLAEVPGRSAIECGNARIQQ